VSDWEELAAAHEQRYLDGEARLAEVRDRGAQLTRMANAASACGLALLMIGRAEEAAEWFHRAAARYRESWADAPPGSWGRPIAVLKSLVLAGDWEAATAAAGSTLDAGAADAESAIARYAATLALLVLGRDEEARKIGSMLLDRDDFPPAVASALCAIADSSRAAYRDAVDEVLASFETRDAHLGDVAVADTVLVLEALAARHGLDSELRRSPVLPI
jgi:tetratricopeptide (TPR) repeat protein